LNLKEGINEAFKLYVIARSHLDRCVGPDKVYLDFGCGVGRIFKTFMRDYTPENMIGLDATEEFIEICRNDFGAPYRFLRINTRPPCPLPDDSVDVITAYSVFSHFSAVQATRWLDEFNRIVRPGGTLILTTYGRGHLNYVCDTPVDKLPPNKKTQLKDIEEAGGKSEFLRMFGLGEMLFYTRNPVFGLHDYGHAYVGEEFVRRIWGHYFDVVEIVDDYERLEQMVVVMRKRG
jgi:SAM-dependent methyltransferase